MALSKLCPERLPAISWIQLKTSGDPVSKLQVDLWLYYFIENVC